MTAERTTAAAQAVPAPAPAVAPGHAQVSPRNFVQGSLIVEDDVSAADPPRMRKREFLDELQDAMCRAIEEGFQGSEYEGRGCPMVTEAIDFYRHLPAESLEAAIRRYTPESASARRARDYIDAISRKVRTVLQEFMRTGRIPSIPPELAPLAAQMMLRRAGGIGGLITAAFGGVMRSVGSAISGAFRALFLHRSEPIGPSVDARAVRTQLGPGARLDGGVRTRMERAFGHEFSSIRIHTDERSGAVADRLGARALTVGSDVAFAPGEYQPGTPVGDAIIAHELAHTIQQGDDATARAPSHDLETDADTTAAHALSTLWGGERVGAIKPRRRAGLRLQRCPSAQQRTAQTTAIPSAPQPSAWEERPRPDLSSDDVKKAYEASEAAESDPDQDKRREKWLEAFKHALRPLGREMVLAKKPATPGQKQDPADYEPLPKITVDPELNQKIGYDKRDRDLSQNGGTTFEAVPPSTSTDETQEVKVYVTVGPRAFKARGWRRAFSALQLAQHELTHAERHKLGGAKKRGLTHPETELEAHTLDFVGYFDLLTYRAEGGIGGESWSELLVNYRKSRGAAKDKTFNMLLAYYRKPPKGETKTPEKIRETFMAWLQAYSRDESGLIDRLKKAIGAGEVGGRK